MLPDVPYFVPDFAVGNWVMPLHFGQDAPAPCSRSAQHQHTMMRLLAPSTTADRKFLIVLGKRAMGAGNSGGPIEPSGIFARKLGKPCRISGILFYSSQKQADLALLRDTFYYYGTPVTRIT
jgi:hypothetical protein